MQKRRIALVGEYDGRHVAHRAIDRCFSLTSSAPALSVEQRWLRTGQIAAGEDTPLRGYAGIWVVPASPYESPEGALWAIEYARTRQIPFLGTCGGFQHMVLEYARNVLGLTDADHQENNPATAFPLFHRMACSLVEKKEQVLFTQESQLRKMIGADTSMEGFHCSFGFNPRYASLLESGDLRVAAHSTTGDLRGVEHRKHPFFVGTLFQPERRALEGELHPIVVEFMRAAGSGSAGSG